MSSRPEPVDPPDDPIIVERVGGYPWRPLLVLGLIGVALGLGLLKPWDTEHPPQTTNRPVAEATAAPTQSPATAPATSPMPTPMPGATIDPVIDAAMRRALCFAPEQWQLLSMETSELGNSRTVYFTDAVSASGPSDPSIPTARLGASSMLGIGVCRPNPKGLRVADLPFPNVNIWRDVDHEAPIEVMDPPILNDGLYRLGEAYFGPPSSGADGVPDPAMRPGWQPGRYVLEIDDASSSGAALWLALDFSKIQASAGAATSQ